MGQLYGVNTNAIMIPNLHHKRRTRRMITERPCDVNMSAKTRSNLYFRHQNRRAITERLCDVNMSAVMIPNLSPKLRPAISLISLTRPHSRRRTPVDASAVTLDPWTLSTVQSINKVILENKNLTCKYFISCN